MHRAEHDREVDVSASCLNRSPWMAQLADELDPRPLDGDCEMDVAIVGAGIAGVATAYFVLRDTDQRVLLVESHRAGSGATGHNAGQLATYFERPLNELVDEFGFDRAIAAQAAVESAMELLAEMVSESNATVRIEHMMAHMGMFSLNHLEVHLATQVLRRRGGLGLETCVVSKEAPYLNDIPADYSDLYSVVPQAQIRELLQISSDVYSSVLSAPRACANSAVLVDQLIRFMMARYPDRFRFVDHTPIERVLLREHDAALDAGGHTVHAKRAILCTNGFVDCTIENDDKSVQIPQLAERIGRNVGYMNGFVDSQMRPPVALSFIRNREIGGETPYIYLTRRAYEHSDREVTLTCVGGPESTLNKGQGYDPRGEFPASKLNEMTRAVDLVRSGVNLPPGLPEFAWHGVMGYTKSRIRLIGEEPRNPVLMYNLGCNGVGFLPSVYGGRRIAQLLTGDKLDPSIFDPT